MRILLTGADGFLGRNVHGKLANAGHQVLGVSRRSVVAEGFVRCDLEQPHELMALLERENIECVVNLAARIDFSDEALARLLPINVLSPGLIAHQCHRQNIHLVHASSIAVNGNQTASINATSVRSPNTDYGVSKSLAEQIIEASGAHSAIIRFAGIFGSSTEGHLGVNRSIVDARNGKLPVLTGDGLGKRNYLYVKDAAEMVAAAVHERLAGTYCAAGEVVTIRDMLKNICDQWLDGALPVHSAGSKSGDQIVESSPELGAFRSFSEALMDIDENCTVV